MKKIITSIVLLIALNINAQNILELNPSNFPITIPSGFINFNNKLFYIGTNTTYGRELWLTDGTLSGQQLLKNIGFQYGLNVVSAFQDQTGEASFGKSYVFNGKLFFNASQDYSFSPIVFTADGTEAGTIPFDPNNTKINFIRYFKEFNGRLYFTAYNNISGTEIWSTDGTLAGTTLLKDINPGTGTSVYYDPSFTVFNNKMYFKADDGVHGMELWSTNGTEAGTSLLIDINLGTYDTSSIGTFIRNGNFLDEHFKVAGNKFYFRGYQANDPNDTYSLYVSDGTAAGTQRISYLNGYGYSVTYDGLGLTVLNNMLYYYGIKNIPSPISGGGTTDQVGIFTTDGTTAGTTLIKDFGNSVFNFFGDNGWSDDDTTPNSMRIVNGKAYFLNNLRLWCTDGTTNGTVRITNDSFDAFDYQKRMVSQEFDGKFYFVKNAGPGTQTGIYSATGTASSVNYEGKSNSQHATNAETLNMSSFPSQLKAFGNSLYFSADYGSGTKNLWRLRSPSLSATQSTSYSSTFHLYPNPTSNVLNLNFENNLENAILKIISLTGQTVFEQQNITGTILNLDVSGLNSGLYLIQISNGSSIYNSKFIKK